MRTLILALVVLLFASVLHSCLSEESYSTSARHGLESVDTLDFDTVISGETSSTRSFWLYNNNGEDLRIVSTTLAQGTSSDFGVNVDGTYIDGSSTQFFDIRKNDSIKVFVQVSPTAKDSDLPVPTDDVLSFTLAGGARHDVILKAMSQDMIMISGAVYTADTTLSPTRPLRIMDSIIVAEGATLTIAPGTRMYFHLNAGIKVRGTLRAEGTIENPIKMNGDRLDYMFEKQPYSRIPGQWGGITFAAESFGNVIDFCHIESGTTGIRCDSSDVANEKIRIENSIIHNMEADGISLKHVNAYIGNSQITNAGGNCVSIVGGHYTMIHNTIANFYPFSINRGIALYFANNSAGVSQPLTAANFINCIITGYSTDEILGSNDNVSAFEYLFSHSLLNTPRDTTDTRIINCQWDTSSNAVAREKNFTPAFDLTTLTFSFTPDSASLAIGNADYATTLSTYPQDLTGKSRTTTGKSDIGCYEH